MIARLGGAKCHVSKHVFCAMVSNALIHVFETGSGKKGGDQP